MRRANGSNRSGSALHPPKAVDDGGFLPAVESLRGMAALMVAGFHALIWLDPGADARFLVLPVWEHGGGWQALVTRALLMLFNGGAAVVLFFVLSGFVLHASLARGMRGSGSEAVVVVRFLVRRVVRLAPAFVVALALTAMVIHGLAPLDLPSQAGGWLAWFSFAPPDAGAFGANLALLRADLNPVTWTLRIELAASLMLVAAFLLARWSSAVFMVALALMVVLSPAWGVEHLGRHAYLFVLGLAADRWGREAFAALRLSQRSARRVFYAGLALLLLPGVWTMAHALPADATSGLGAALMLCVLSCRKPAGRNDDSIACWLERRPLRLLGRMSYSFYLLHFPVLLVVSQAALHGLPGPWVRDAPLAVMAGVAAQALPVAFAVAWLVFSAVEQPALRWGRRAAGAPSERSSVPRHPQR